MLRVFSAAGFPAAGLSTSLVQGTIRSMEQPEIDMVSEARSSKGEPNRAHPGHCVMSSSRGAALVIAGHGHRVATHGGACVQYQPEALPAALIMELMVPSAHRTGALLSTQS